MTNGCNHSVETDMKEMSDFNIFSKDSIQANYLCLYSKTNLDCDSIFHNHAVDVFLSY